ncbi:AraC family transcriptional regulator [Novosphingobium sp.]|uniref:helix-turn-helix domain-containing protein n=1 Tax=Novosphingobium sp. TaxID=1874826 RepID=UPI0026186019|nr:AraC family transcriptional regulator [Novosphingobium sp.]
MDSNALYATLPDLSARIMRSALASETRVDWDDFCRNSHVRPVRFDAYSGQLLAQEELQLQKSFAACTAGARNIWFDIGLRYRAIKYGELGLAMMTARTLGEAMQIACRCQSLTYSLINYRYASAPNGALALIGSCSKLAGPLHDFTHYRDLGAIRTLVADLMGGVLPLERVTLTTPPPPDWAQQQHHFPCPVQFNADQTQWLFLPGAANLALPMADSDLVTLYSSRCDTMLRRAQTDATIKGRLAARLSRSDSDFPTAGEAARMLALSERTLHRRLAEEGTRFSAMIDEARYCRARELLMEGHMAIEQIAVAVGFAEPSSFSRAFKRWSGMGALEFRRQSQTSNTRLA